MTTTPPPPACPPRLRDEPERQLAQVTASTDLGQLDRWFERSLTAATAAEVFRD
jgi:hypothetical protein